MATDLTVSLLHEPGTLLRASDALGRAGVGPGLILGLAAYSNNSLVGLTAILVLIYCVSWIAIGLELLLRGVPLARPAAQSAS